ncbi:ribonuclease H [Tanacetum coccineum]|uniref:Ribonuclease H n=1 Tax=Tanacetum coccineum TaxID=301880 RepID=A0ABQ4ZSR8_9ASTR
MLKRCEDTNLVLNWEKCHFMCREGIVLGHKTSKSGIEVNRAIVDVIAKLPHPTTVKGVRSFLVMQNKSFERTVGENRASWSDKLDDALWVFRTAFKTPIGCTPYKLVYEKSCHLPIELEHKAYWASKHANFNFKTTASVDYPFVFNDDDIEERTSRWVNKCIKKFNPYARHEIVARRANGSIVSTTKPDYKNLNKNDIEDMNLLIMNNKVPDYANTGLQWSLSVFIRSSVIWERVHDFQLGIESYQQKINLTAPTITFLGIKECDVFSIIYEPVHGIIYTNSKKEKRVMRPSEIHKFCDATLKRTLEGLKSYYNDVKYGYVQKELTNDELEFLKLFEEEIEVWLKTITPTGSQLPRLQDVDDLEGDDLLYYDAEMELTNMILLSIPNEIYNSVDSCKTAKEMWDRVERLMRGTIETRQLSN